jgi:hypothetical protein
MGQRQLLENPRHLELERQRDLLNRHRVLRARKLRSVRSATFARR